MLKQERAKAYSSAADWQWTSDTNWVVFVFARRIIEWHHKRRSTMAAISSVSKCREKTFSREYLTFPWTWIPVKSVRYFQAKKLTFPDFHYGVRRQSDLRNFSVQHSTFITIPVGVTVIELIYTHSYDSICIAYDRVCVRVPPYTKSVTVVHVNRNYHTPCMWAYFTGYIELIHSTRSRCKGRITCQTERCVVNWHPTTWKTSRNRPVIHPFHLHSV